jgi:hypothetical protein
MESGGAGARDIATDVEPVRLAPSSGREAVWRRPSISKGSYQSKLPSSGAMVSTSLVQT